jgi:hypothetical protein
MAPHDARFGLDVRAMPGDTAAELRGRFERAARPYLTDAGLEFPGVALLATVRR